MHLKWLYPRCHRLHHLSVSPTPFAAFAFHPIEALIQSFVFVILLVAVPLHYSVFFTFSIFSMVINVYGHLGFNLFSENALNRFPLSLVSHSAQHGWHHRHYDGNYGFYFRIWDKCMGTDRGGLKPKSA